MKNLGLKTLALSVAATCLTVSAVAAPFSAVGEEGNIVIKAGKVVTLAGEAIENGTIVIENGRVTAVGKDIKYPWNSVVKEYPNSVAYPGFIEAVTNSGMDRANENIDVAAFLNVKDSIDPVNFYFEDALRAGITTINVQQGEDCVVGGMGYVVKPVGLTVEAMTIKPNSGLAMSATPKRGKTRGTQTLGLRRAFSDLRMYLESVVQEKKDGSDAAKREAMYQGREPDEETSKGRAMESSAWKVEGLESIPRWEIDEKQAPLLKIVENKTTVFFYASSPSDVHTALTIAKDNGFLDRTVLVVGTSCWKAADQIAAAGVPVVLPQTLVHLERDPITGEESETFVPRVFQDKGIKYALRSLGSSAQSLWYQAALCVAHGLTREQAIAAITTTPAELLGLTKRLGTLEAGKDGNVVIYSGDPLSVTSNVQYVVVEGHQVYDRSTDARIRHLQTGEQPANTSADVETGTPHVHEDPVEEDTKKVDEGENEEKKKGEDDDGHKDGEKGDGHDDHDGEEN